MPIIVNSYGAEVLRIGIDNTEIIVPRYLSSLGQYLPGYNWIMPPTDAVIDEYFYLNGRFTLEDKLYISKQKSNMELDSELEDLIGQELEGAIICGIVVGIYAIYTDSSVVEYLPSDIEFFEDSEEATHDHYAFEVYVIIQDGGTYVEYPINLKFLSKMI